MSVARRRHDTEGMGNGRVEFDGGRTSYAAPRMTVAEAIRRVVRTIPHGKYYRSLKVAAVCAPLLVVLVAVIQLIWGGDRPLTDKEEELLRNATRYMQQVMEETQQRAEAAAAEAAAAAAALSSSVDGAQSATGSDAPAAAPWEAKHVFTALATTGTDPLKLLVAASLARAGRRFEAFIAVFTWLASSCYHWCNSVRSTLFLDEIDWHKLDNGARRPVLPSSAQTLLTRHTCAAVGSMVWASTTGIELGGFPPGEWRDSLMYLALTVALLSQECDPWNVLFTLVPILSFYGLSILRWVAIAADVQSICGMPLPRPPPPPRLDALLGWAVSGFFALVAFGKGLDDRRDWLRLWHGAWHVLLAAAAHYSFQVFEWEVGGKAVAPRAKFQLFASSRSSAGAPGAVV